MPEPRELVDFLAWRPEPLKAILSDGLLYEGSKGILYGRYKTWKSMLAMHLGLCVAEGVDWLGFHTPPGGVRVMYLQLEIPEQLLQKRLMKMLGASTTTQQQIWFWSEHNLKIDEANGWNRLDEQVKLLAPTLLIVDPIYKVMSGNLLELNAVNKLTDRIDGLLESNPQLAVLLVSHTRKGAYEETWGSDDLIGSMVFSAWADSVIKVERSVVGLKMSFDVIRHAENTIEPREFVVDQTNLTFTQKRTQVSFDGGTVTNDQPAVVQADV